MFGTPLGGILGTHSIDQSFHFRLPRTTKREILSNCCARFREFGRNMLVHETVPNSPQ
jgi:hypothetical protein